MNILLNGDSISYTGGYTDSQGKLWYHQFPKEYSLTNLSSVTQSNSCILTRTCNEILKNPKKYNLVIVQWGKIDRLSLFHKEDRFGNYFSMPNPVEYCTKWTDSQKLIQELWLNNFVSDRHEILEYISCITLLYHFLKSQQINFVFIKGFDNFFNDIKQANWVDSSEEYLTKLMFRDQLPDHDIDILHQELRTPYLAMVDQTNDVWVNLHDPSWANLIYQLKSEFPEIYSNDLADDNKHGGILTNQYYYKLFVDFIKKKGLVF